MRDTQYKQINQYFTEMNSECIEIRKEILEKAKTLAELIGIKAKDLEQKGFSDIEVAYYLQMEVYAEIHNMLVDVLNSD